MPSVSLTDINAQLALGGIRLEARGKKNLLRLIAVLPNKDGIRKQYKISLHLSSDIPYQLKEAYEISIKALALKTDGWDWGKFEEILGGKTPTHKNDLAEGIDRYMDYRKASGVSSWTLKREFVNVLDKLLAVSDRPSIKLFQDFLGQYPKNSAVRKSNYESCVRLCKFNNWNYDLSPYKSTYGTKEIKPRVLPTMDKILETEKNFTGSDEWRWALRMLICYGLRPHEVHFSTVKNEFPYPCFVAKGKTGARTTYPFPPELVAKWELWNKPEFNINLERPFVVIGGYTSDRLIAFGSERPYQYRHAYSLRGHVLHNQPAKVMAKLMGHDVSTWTESYSRWLDEEAMTESYMKSITTDQPPQY